MGFTHAGCQGPGAVPLFTRFPLRGDPPVARLWPEFPSGNRNGRPLVSNPFIWLILTVIDMYMWIVIIGVVLSWLVSFNVVNRSNRFIYIVGDFLHRATEPALKPIRRVLPNLGNMDLSPVALILLLMFAQRFILWASYAIG